MPRHPEGLVEWILSVQSALTAGGYDEPPPGREPAPRGGAAGGRAGPPTGGAARVSTPTSDSMQAYSDAKDGSKAARLRNQGGGMAAVFGGD